MPTNSEPQRTRRHGFRWWPFASWIGIGVLALVYGACRAPEHLATLRYVDLVTSAAWTSSRGEVTAPKQGFCADETHFAQPLADGETLSAAVEIGAAGELTISGCVAEGRPPGAVRLALMVEGQDGARLEQTAALSATSGWWRHREDLAAFEGQTVRLSLTREGGGQRPLYLRDVFVRHERADPPTATPTSDAAAPRDAAAPPLQVLLISVDTLRADAIAALGGTWPTPRLDALIAESQTFERSWSAASWTKPSHASMLTGQSPQVHGALSQVAGLHPAIETVSERLGQQGLHTSALVQDIVHLDARFGFDRGFDEYRTEHWTLPQMARYTVDWLARYREQPFFFFLHTFAAHSDFKHLPYEAPGLRVEAVDQRFGVENYGCTGPYCASGRLARINEGEVTPLPNEGAILRYLYGEGVQATDAALGTLFDDLRALGMWDRLMIVLTSDHGEAFLEHGTVLHGDHWENVMRVPLVIKWPGGELAGTRPPFNVSTLDVTPTLLSAAGIDPEGLPGSDLRVLRRKDRPLMLGTYARTLIQDRYKLMVIRQGGPMHLFDLEVDPGEQSDLIDSRPRVREQLLDHMRSHIRDAHRAKEALDRREAAGAVQPLSDEERARLESLGYLDG